MKKRLLFLRWLHTALSFLRIIFIAGATTLAGYNFLLLFNKSIDSLKQGTFAIVSSDIPVIVSIIALLLFAILCFLARKPLMKMSRYVEGEIEGFEDMAEYSKKKHLKPGQIDDDGNLTINLRLKRGSNCPENDIAKLIGLESVKKEIAKMQAVFEYEKKTKVNKEKIACRHYAFLGNPGTGKTTVAKIFAGILYKNKRIKRNVYLECTGNDLTAEYAGQTKNKVDAIYNLVKGGVLFIDEAYILCQGKGGMAEEAIAQLLVRMESDPYTVIIFAGYTANMREFLNLNPGLASRVSQVIHFSNYSAHELYDIFKKFAQQKNVSINDDARDTLIKLFMTKLSLIKVGNNNFSNGRYVRNCFDEIYEQHAINAVTAMRDGTGELNNNITSFDIIDIQSQLLTFS